MSQETSILEHLQSGKTITPLEALNSFGCFRLASRICDLKKQGHIIEKTNIISKNNKRFAVYKLGTKDDLFKGVSYE